MAVWADNDVDIFDPGKSGMVKEMGGADKIVKLSRRGESPYHQGLRFSE
jgi:hypothetical protein